MSRPYVPRAPIHRIAVLVGARGSGLSDSHQQAQVSHPVVQMVVVTPMIMSVTSRSSVLWHRYVRLPFGGGSLIACTISASRASKLQLHQ